MRPGHVAVVGAGPCGLAAAWTLARAGVQVTVLEASDRVGGLAGSFDFGGYKVDYGPHRLHRAASARVLALYADLLGQSLRERPRRGKLHFDLGAEVDYPFTFTGLARGLGPLEIARMGASVMRARLRESGSDFAGAASRRLGRRAVERVYRPSMLKAFGLPLEELDPALAGTRVSRKGPMDLALAMLGLGGKRGGQRYFYPREGAGAVAESLVRALGGRGAKLLLESPVTRLERSGGRVVVHAREPLEADAVIATSPLTGLLRATGRDEAAVEAEASLGWRAVVLLYVELARPRLSDRDVHYFPSAARPFNRLFEAANFLGEAGRETTVVGMDFGCQQGDATWSASAVQLLDRAWDALRELGVQEREVRATTVRRFANAYPVYRRGFQPARARALDALSDVEGVFPAGRQGLFVHNNIHHSLDAGFQAADAVLAGATSREWRSALEPLLLAEVLD